MKWCGEECTAANITRVAVPTEMLSHLCLHSNDSVLSFIDSTDVY